MLSKSFAAFILLVLASSVNADFVAEPALGVSGAPVAGDVQHPSTGNPCGTPSIPQNIDSSSCVQADTDGSFTASFTNFGTDKPTINTMQVNPDGTGDKFVPGKVPTVDGTSIKGNLPSGTKCTGGADKNICVVSFVGADKSGNCILVKQPAEGTTGNTPVPSPTPANPHGAKAPVATPTPSQTPQGSANAKGQGANGNGNTDNTHNGTSGNGTDSYKGSTGGKRDGEARMRNRNFKRVHVQGMRL